MNILLLHGDTQGQATFGMANLRQRTTGLPFIVFISQRDDARHAARVKVAPEPKVPSEAVGSYALDPFGFKAGRQLSSREEILLETWVALNRSVLQDYWDGVVEYTEDAIARIQSV
jgi:hypothetical protein